MWPVLDLQFWSFNSPKKFAPRCGIGHEKKNQPSCCCCLASTKFVLVRAGRGFLPFPPQASQMNTNEPRPTALLGIFTGQNNLPFAPLDTPIFCMFVCVCDQDRSKTEESAPRHIILYLLLGLSLTCPPGKKPYAFPGTHDP